MKKRCETKHGDVQKETKKSRPFLVMLKTLKKEHVWQNFGWGSFWLPSVMPCCKAGPFHQQSQKKTCLFNKPCWSINPQLISLISCISSRNRNPPLKELTIF